MQYHQLWSKLP
uniref:Uncharacterized protein n=1 Tax=Rhizophora mucronata TaxID=61149 RepID=A0A2P2Q9N1_RHIMU